MQSASALCILGAWMVSRILLKKMRNTKNTAVIPVSLVILATTHIMRIILEWCNVPMINFFERFSMGLIADLLFTTRDATQLDSFHFFWNRSPQESFHLIAAELNLVYETLFTKLYAAHTKLGYFFRAMSFGNFHSLCLLL
ncbi:hypothetical protein M0R45_000065 [Rubus argutus]|uniref:DUF4220 domain-containing protein n=1 Tax=Rubus argutus TaxID=59490 RepID=A0AAW1VQW8_RUBAR